MVVVGVGVTCAARQDLLGSRTQPPLEPLLHDWLKVTPRPPSPSGFHYHNIFLSVCSQGDEAPRPSV